MTGDVGTGDVGTGLDRLDPRVRRMWAEDAASRGLGMELVSAGPGTAVVRMTVRDAMVNGHRIGHGGFVFAVADSAFAVACNSHGPVAVAHSADIRFLAPVHLGDVLVARAVERSREGRRGVYDVTVHVGDALVARFTGRSSELGAEPAPGPPAGPTEPPPEPGAGRPPEPGAEAGR